MDNQETLKALEKILAYINVKKDAIGMAHLSVMDAAYIESLCKMGLDNSQKRD